MKAFEIAEFGPDKLSPTTRPDPEPGPGEILLRMGAVSLNYRDLLMLAGKYNPRMRLPVIPCSDGAGEVVALGPGVKRFRAGDRAAPIFAQGWLCGEPTRAGLKDTLGGPLDGTLAEYIVVPAEAAVKVPEHLSDAEAASLPCAGLTAWSAIVTYGNVKPGSTVLVLGTGGVSIFALQFAKLMGARVIVSSSSDEKLQRAGELGADELINYREKPAWEKEVYKRTEGAGVDLVVEVGGPGTLEKSIRSVRPGGTISLIGILAGRKNEVDLTPVLMQNILIQGIVVGHRDGFEAMNQAVARNRLRPVVDQVFAFDEAPRAYDTVAAAKHFGKVCINVNG